MPGKRGPNTNSKARIYYSKLLYAVILKINQELEEKWIAKKDAKLL